LLVFVINGFCLKAILGAVSSQGSGKSLSMVFFTGKIVLALDNPTILVITDRNDLDDQLFDTFAASNGRLFFQRMPRCPKCRFHCTIDRIILMIGRQFFNRFNRHDTRKTADGKEEASHLVSQLETLIKGMLNKETLLDLIQHFKSEPALASRPSEIIIKPL
jgi:hypothetical protein